MLKGFIQQGFERLAGAMPEHRLDRGFHGRIHRAELATGDLFAQQSFGRCSEGGGHGEKLSLAGNEASGQIEAASASMMAGNQSCRLSASCSLTSFPDNGLFSRQ
jgi:hypothetical protein